MKRILIIIGILIAAVIVVTVGMLLRDNSAAPAAPSGSLPISGTLPIAGNGDTATPVGNNGGNGNAGTNGENNLPIAGVEAVAQAAVIDYAVSSDGVTFIASNGAVISAQNAENLGQADFGEILSAQFSPNGKWLLVKSSDNDRVSWTLMDVAKKTWKSIQADASEMVWSRDGSQLAYFANAANRNTLTTYTPATGATKAMLTMSAPDLRVRWKDASHMLIMDRPSSLVAGNIWEFGTVAGTLTPLVTNVSGAEILWGGADNGGLLFKAGPTSGSLVIVNSEGATTQATTFLTLPSKCAFGESAATSTISDLSDYLFCAIPQDQGTLKSHQLPDDYLKGKFGTADTLHAINLARGTLTAIIPASETFIFDAENLKVYGENVYFVNRNDSKLYKASLSALPVPTGPATDGS